MKRHPGAHRSGRGPAGNDELPEPQKHLNDILLTAIRPHPAPPRRQERGRDANRRGERIVATQATGHPTKERSNIRKKGPCRFEVKRPRTAPPVTTGPSERGLAWVHDLRDGPLFPFNPAHAPVTSDMPSKVRTVAKPPRAATTTARSTLGSHNVGPAAPGGTVREHIEYHRDGTVWARGQVRRDKPTGSWVWFRKDGTRLRSGTFEDGRQVGEWTTYDRQGEVYKVTVMKPGIARAATTTSARKKVPASPGKPKSARPAATPGPGRKGPAARKRV